MSPPRAEVDNPAEFLAKDSELSEQTEARRAQLIEVAERFGTPVEVFHEDGIRDTLRRLRAAFSWAPDYQEFYAVKAAPIPDILQIVAEEGGGADCSSATELVIAHQMVGLPGERVMFTSNNTPVAEFQMAQGFGSIVNFDDPTHVDIWQAEVGPLPELGCLRYTPRAFKMGNTIIGEPAEAKFGMRFDQLWQTYQRMQEAGVKRFGLHAMIVSNERSTEAFRQAADELFGAAASVSDRLGIEFEFVNLGGGFGIPYRPGEEPLQLAQVSEAIAERYQAYFGSSGPAIYTEFGRYVTGPQGVLVTETINTKSTYRRYAGVDGSEANLLRPAMYSNAYHHVTALDAEEGAPTETVDVVSSLCENKKLAEGRSLPRIERGDRLAIHDVGAHGSAMGFNYNGKLKGKAVLLRSDGSIKEIARAQTVDDVFATFPDEWKAKLAMSRRAAVGLVPDGRFG